MRHRLIASTLGAIACVIACLATGVAGGGGGTSASHFATFASSPPVTGTVSVTTSGQCPVGMKVWCNATALVPAPATGAFTDELSIVNPAQAAIGAGGYLGSITDTGGFVTAGVFVGPGAHTANTLWNDELAYSGLVSVYASAPCALKWSELWLNLTTFTGVYTSTGALVASKTGTIPVTYQAVTTATACVVHAYFGASLGVSVPQSVPFTAPLGGTYHLITTSAVSAVIGYTQDSCAIFGANWGFAGGWSWGYPTACPGGFAAPTLPPPYPNTGLDLAASTIV